MRTRERKEEEQSPPNLRPITPGDHRLLGPTVGLDDADSLLGKYGLEVVLYEDFWYVDKKPTKPTKPNKLEAHAADVQKADKTNPIDMLHTLIGFQNNAERLTADLENLIMEVYETYKDSIDPEYAEALGLPRPYPYPVVAVVRSSVHKPNRK